MLLTPKKNDFSHLKTPCLMGVLNVTPNSFSDGGEFFDPPTAVARCLEMIHQGAKIIDIGAEASSFFRPGVQAVSAEEQLQRLVPVLAAIKNASGLEKIWLSVDTRSAQVARKAMEMGVEVINDVSAGQDDPEMLDAVAGGGACIILMHRSLSYPSTAPADDADILRHVQRELEQRIRAAQAAGIPAERIAIDPGIGFGQTMADNWRLATATQQFSQHWGAKFPIVMGASRKRFLATPVPGDVVMPSDWTQRIARLNSMVPRHARDGLTATLVGLAWEKGVIHRVHDVKLAMAAVEGR